MKKMTTEPYSDTECITQGDYFSGNDFISQSINEGLFIAQKNSLGDRDQKIIENHTFPNSSINSEVEYTLTFDCLFKCGSFDQIDSLSFNARARKSVSLWYIGINERASGKNCLYSSKGINSTNIARSLLNSLNFSRDMLVFPMISSEYLLISSSANSGEKNSKSWSTNKPLVNECFQKNVNRILVSTTNFIYITPFLFNSSNLPFLDALCSLTDQSVISFSSSNCFTSLLTKIDMFTPDSFISLFSSSGISTFNSAILHQPNYYEIVYLNLMELKVFSGKYQYCDPSVVDGTGKCSKYPNNLDIWIDYADTGVAVNKQPGDKLKLNIFSEQDATLSINYDKDVFDSNDCFTFHPINPGINTCSLAVKDGIGKSEEEIKVENKITDVNIISNPELLIITDSEKLNQEFYQEPNAVKAVLKQTYASAEKNNGVVYDLSWYKNELGVNNRFKSFINYFEKITKPNMVDNSYSLAVSDFIKDRCEDCKDVMIVGDDFVVPGYRNEFKVDTIWLPFLNKINQHNIYTDQPYRMVTGIPQINELDLIFTQEGRVQDKQVMFIVPDEIDSELRASIDNLKAVIQTKFKTDDIPEKKGSELIIGDYGIAGTTLIIIGNLENNPAMRYYPFALSIDYDMWIDRNLWDPNRGFLQKEEYALILKIDSSYEIDLAAGIINSEFYKEVNGEGINWIALGGGALLIIASPFTGPAAPFVAAAGIAVLSADTVDNCLIENQAGQNFDECAGNIVLDIATAGIFKLVKPLAEPLVKKFGKAV